MADKREAANPVDEFFVKAHKAVLFDTSLSANDLRVYLGFRHFARPERGKMTVWPSIKTLARTLNLSTRQVDRSIATLASKGLIERKQTKSTALTTLTRMSCVYENLDHVPHKADSHSGVSRPADVADLDTPPAADRSRCSEGDNDPEQKARERVTDSPTQRPLPEVRELTRVPAEDTVPYRPLARSKKPPSPKYVALGCGAREFWKEFVSEPGLAPAPASWTPATLAKAGKTVAALKDSPFADKTLRELMPLLVARLKTCNPKVKQAVNFGWLFCADAPNLARMLAGDWDVEAGQEVKPARREIPDEDQWPGLDEEAYWREKDAEQERGGG